MRWLGCLIDFLISMFTRASRQLHRPPQLLRFSGEEDPWTSVNVETSEVGTITLIQDNDGDPGADTITVTCSGTPFSGWAASGNVRLVGSLPYKDANGHLWDDFWQFLTRGRFKSGDVVPFTKTNSSTISIIPGEFSDGSSQWVGAVPGLHADILGVAEITSTSGPDLVPCLPNNDLRGKSDIWKETDDGELIFQLDGTSDDHTEVIGGEVVASVI